MVAFFVASPDKVYTLKRFSWLNFPHNLKITLFMD